MDGVATNGTGDPMAMGSRANGRHGPIRLLMYSHDGFGLGHYRRILKLAAFLRAELSEVSILMITGSSMAHAFRIPYGIDYVKLPCVSKESNEVYTAKHLPLSFDTIKSIRERIVLGTALAYQPDVFLIDKHPLGMKGELQPTLKALKAHHPKTKVVLGLRDILDDPSEVIPYFRTPAIADALENIYDEIWVYGDQSFYDPIKEYRIADRTARKVRFCGYVSCDTPSLAPAEIRRELGIGEGKFVLVTAGAGGDGFPILDAYLKALDFLPKELDACSLLVSGPDMPERERAALLRHSTGAAASSRRRTEFLDFSPRMTEHIAAADAVVCMAGYNTLLEVVSLRKEAVVIPRISPRLEQLIRAAAFEKRGLIRMIRPDCLSPKILAENIVDALHTPALPVDQRLNASGIDLNGLEGVKTHLLRLLSSGNGKRHGAPHSAAAGIAKTSNGALSNGRRHDAPHSAAIGSVKMVLAER